MQKITLLCCHEYVLLEMYMQFLDVRNYPE